MRLSPDEIVLWQRGFAQINATLVGTWVVMWVMALGASLITRRLSSDHQRSRWQNALEIIVTAMVNQLREVGLRDAERYLSFVGTLFLFIAVSNLASVIPGFQSPTASLSTTTALALCVFVAVPMFGIQQQGLLRYVKTYVQPSPVMLPFNLISEASRTLALAVRLFGNMMSAAMIIAVLLTVTPLLFPVVMTALGLLTGMVQAYIFSILAGVYIAAAIHAHEPTPPS